MGFKTFVAGEEAIAADVNAYLMAQTVARFTTTAQRTAQLPAPVLNQLSMTDDRPGVVTFWNGTAWTQVVGDSVAFSFTAEGGAGNSATAGNFATQTVGSFTMPFAGDCAITGWISINATGGPGFAMSNSRLLCSPGTVTLNPDAINRIGAAALQDTWTAPSVLLATGIAAGATVTISAYMFCSSGVTLAIQRMAALVTAIRK